jgi:hypothetical protein
MDTQQDKRRKDAERQRVQYERDKAKGIIKVCVKIHASRRAELLAFAKTLDNPA